MNLKKAMKKMTPRDMAFTKLSVFFFTLFLIAVWSGFHNLVMGFAWYWYLILMFIFAIPVWKKMQ